MIRPGDCLATAVAAMLDIDVLDLPSAVDPDWERGYPAFRRALAERGWRISFFEQPEDDEVALDDILANDALEADEVDQRMHWLVSVSHPSWDGAAHVIVVRGGEIVFDPGGDVLERPPLAELRYGGGFVLSPLDPGLFQLVSL
jgi:hypothetical protein